MSDMVTEEQELEKRSPLEAFVEATRETLKQVQQQLSEIELLIEQSQGEVDKLAQRNSTIAARLHQIQANFDTVPREDIRATYEAAQDLQQRLFTMRGQLEKLQSDQAHLQQFADYLTQVLQLLEGSVDLDLGDGDQAAPATATIEQVIHAQEEERRKISRQIHDGPAQALSNFILQTEIALRLFDNDPQRAREELVQLKEAAAHTFNQVRDFIFDLRPMMLDDLGVVPTVRRYIEAFQDKTGLDVNLVVTGTERRFEPHLEVLVFRAVQELLGNVRDHAQATQVRVKLDLDDDLVRATVEDNGRGFDPGTILEGGEGEPRGLAALRERVLQVGGTFEVESAEGQGTRVWFTVPTAA